MNTLNQKLKTMLRLAIYTICSVILVGEIQAANPAQDKTIGRVIRERPDLSKFLQFIDKASEGVRLSDDIRIRRTVFVPVNSAFDKLSEKEWNTLLDPRNKDRLNEVFEFHISNGYYHYILLIAFR